MPKLLNRPALHLIKAAVSSFSVRPIYRRHFRSQKNQNRNHDFCCQNRLFIHKSRSLHNTIYPYPKQLAQRVATSTFTATARDGSHNLSITSHHRCSCVFCSLKMCTKTSNFVWFLCRVRSILFHFCVAEVRK